MLRKGFFCFPKTFRPRSPLIPVFWWISSDLSSGDKAGGAWGWSRDVIWCRGCELNGTVTPVSLYAFKLCTGTASSLPFQDYYWFLQRLLTFSSHERLFLTRYSCNVACSSQWMCGFSTGRFKFIWIVLKVFVHYKSQMFNAVEGSGMRFLCNSYVKTYHFMVKWSFLC